MGMLTTDIVTASGISRNTIKAHLRKLVVAGHLAQHGLAPRGVWYGIK
jgi:hypothetical protein